MDVISQIDLNLLDSKYFCYKYEKKSTVTWLAGYKKDSKVLIKAHAKRVKISLSFSMPVGGPNHASVRPLKFL